MIPVSDASLTRGVTPSLSERGREVELRTGPPQYCRDWCALTCCKKIICCSVFACIAGSAGTASYYTWRADRNGPVAGGDMIEKVANKKVQELVSQMLYVGKKD